MNERWRDLSKEGAITSTRIIQESRVEAERELRTLTFLAGPFASRENLYSELKDDMGREEKTTIIATFESVLHTLNTNDDSPTKLRSANNIRKTKRAFENSLDQTQTDAIVDSALLDVRKKTAEIAVYDYVLGEDNAITEIAADSKNKPGILKRSVEFLKDIITEEFDQQQ